MSRDTITLQVVDRQYTATIELSGQDAIDWLYSGNAMMPIPIRKPLQWRNCTSSSKAERKARRKRLKRSNKRL